MKIAREEIFGPVLTSIPFDSEEEALEIANDTDYELTGYLWTNDLTRALRFTDRLEAGIIWFIRKRAPFANPLWWCQSIWYWT